MSKLEGKDDIYRMIRKEGSHPASSKKTEGAFRGTLLDDESNQIVGQAEFVKVDPSELEDNSISNQNTPPEVDSNALEDFVIEIVGALGAVVLTEFVAPKVQVLWRERIAPTIKEKWTAVRHKNRPTQNTNIFQINETQIVTVDELNAVQNVLDETDDILLEELVEAHDKYVLHMTDEEAQRELLEIFILMVMLTQKIRKLSSAHIVTGDGIKLYIDGDNLIRQLSNPIYISSINEILSSNPLLLEEKSQYFEKIMGRELIQNNQYVSIESDKFIDLLIQQDTE